MIRALSIILETTRSLVFTTARFLASLWAAAAAFDEAVHFGFSGDAGLWWALAAFTTVCVVLSLFQAVLEIDEVQS